MCIPRHDDQGGVCNLCCDSARSDHRQSDARAPAIGFLPLVLALGELPSHSRIIDTRTTCLSEIRVRYEAYSHRRPCRTRVAAQHPTRPFHDAHRVHSRWCEACMLMRRAAESSAVRARGRGGCLRQFRDDQRHGDGPVDDALSGDAFCLFGELRRGGRNRKRGRHGRPRMFVDRHEPVRRGFSSLPARPARATATSRSGSPPMATRSNVAGRSALPNRRPASSRPPRLAVST